MGRGGVRVQAGSEVSSAWDCLRTQQSKLHRQRRASVSAVGRIQYNQKVSHTNKISVLMLSWYSGSLNPSSATDWLDDYTKSS